MIHRKIADIDESAKAVHQKVMQLQYA